LKETFQSQHNYPQSNTHKASLDVAQVSSSVQNSPQEFLKCVK